MLHPPAHHGAKDHGEAAKAHHHPLGEAALQQRRAEVVIGDAENGEDSGVHHRHGVEQCGDRGGSHGGAGQPAVERPHRRLHAKAEKAQQEHAAQKRLMPCRRPRVQAAPRHKVQHAEAVDKHQRNQRQRSAGHGVEDILPPGIACLALHLVHHQRQGTQGEQFIEEVEGEGVGGAGNAHHHAVGHGEKGEEAALPVLVAHVLKGVEHGDGPQQRHNAQKHQRQTVGVKGEGQAGIDAPKRQRLPGGIEHQSGGKGAGGKGEQHHPRLPHAPAAQGMGQHDPASQQGQEDGGGNQRGFHGSHDNTS